MKAVALLLVLILVVTFYDCEGAKNNRKKTSKTPPPTKKSSKTTTKPSGRRAKLPPPPETSEEEDESDESEEEDSENVEEDSGSGSAVDSGYASAESEDRTVRRKSNKKAVASRKSTKSKKHSHATTSIGTLQHMDHTGHEDHCVRHLDLHFMLSDVSDRTLLLASGFLGSFAMDFRAKAGTVSFSLNDVIQMCGGACLTEAAKFLIDEIARADDEISSCPAIQRGSCGMKFRTESQKNYEMARESLIVCFMKAGIPIPDDYVALVNTFISAKFLSIVYQGFLLGHLKYPKSKA